MKSKQKSQAIGSRSQHEASVTPHASIKYDFKPSVSQRRKSNQIRSAPLRTLFSGSDNHQGVTDHERELSEDEMLEILMAKNQDLKPGDTIRMPSDLMHRRRSRFQESVDLDRPTGDDLNGLDDDAVPTIRMNDLAMTARHRIEEEVVTTYCSKIGKVIDDAYKDATLLKKTLHHIQGKFGSAIMEYFSFIKWLIQINLVIALLSLVVIVPQIVSSFDKSSNFAQLVCDEVAGNYSPLASPLLLTTEAAVRSSTVDQSVSPMGLVQNRAYGIRTAIDPVRQSCLCNERYLKVLTNYTASRPHLHWKAVDLIQGNGFAEYSELFYGKYENLTVYNPVTGTSTAYNMSLAFFTVFFITFVLSFVLILYSFSTSQQQAEISSRSNIKGKVCSLVFTSWDHGLMDRRAVKRKKRLTRTELLQLKEAEEFQKLIAKRTLLQWISIWVIRTGVNVLVLGILIGCVAAVYVAQDKTAELLIDPDRSSAASLALEYLPTFLITAVYVFIPPVFYVLVKAEQYKPSVEIKITMIRIMFLRILSLLFLFFNIFRSVRQRSINVTQDTQSCASNVTAADGSTTLHLCWETFIGQQVYKLVIVDFAVLLGMTFLLEYPRQRIYKRFHKKFKWLKKLGQQEFDMPKNVMDAVYNQMLCWIGVFFSPFIPLMITVKMIIFFMLKRWSLFANQRPSPTLSKSSDVYSFFLMVMLISLVLSYAVLMAFFGFVSPSQSCGPFRLYAGLDARIIDVVPNTIAEFPGWLQELLAYVHKAPVVIALIILLISAIYYYSTLSSAQATKIKVYEKNLAMNITDKQHYHRTVKEQLEEANNNLRKKYSRPQSQRTASSELLQTDDVLADETDSNSSAETLSPPDTNTNTAQHHQVTVEVEVESNESAARSETYDMPNGTESCVVNVETTDTVQHVQETESSHAPTTSNDTIQQEVVQETSADKDADRKKMEAASLDMELEKKRLELHLMSVELERQRQQALLECSARENSQLREELEQMKTRAQLPIPSTSLGHRSLDVHQDEEKGFDNRGYLSDSDVEAYEERMNMPIATSAAFIATPTTHLQHSLVDYQHRHNNTYDFQPDRINKADDEVIFYQPQRRFQHVNIEDAPDYSDSD